MKSVTLPFWRLSLEPWTMKMTQRPRLTRAGAELRSSGWGRKAQIVNHAHETKECGLFCGVGICNIAATLSGSGFILLPEIIVPMNLTSLSLKRSLPALSLMDLWWQRSITAMNLRSCSAWASSKLLPSPYTRMSSAIHTIPSKPSDADVSLIWNSCGALVILNGRRSHLYLPYDVYMIVIHEESSSRGMWRKPSLTSTRGKLN